MTIAVYYSTRNPTNIELYYAGYEYYSSPCKAYGSGYINAYLAQIISKLKNLTRPKQLKHTLFG